MDEDLSMIVIFLLLFLVVIVLLGIVFPIFGISLLSIVILYSTLSSFFPRLIHGKRIYRGHLDVLTSDKFQYYRGHSKRWNLMHGSYCFHYCGSIYFQRTWNPFYVMEIATGKILPYATGWLPGIFWFCKEMYVDPAFDTVDHAEDVEGYLTDHAGMFEGTFLFDEFLKDLQNEAHAVYLAARKDALETDSQIMKRTIRDYHRIHKKGER